MTATEFKELWRVNNTDPWLEFDLEEIEKGPIMDATKDFLKIGFPRDAAPFLSFGWMYNRNKFKSVFESYAHGSLDEDTKNYWLLGSDGGGNTICFDIANKDRIVLLDHEQGFELIEVINNNIAEFAECLLRYKNFIKKILGENGEDAYLDGNITKEQIFELKVGFTQVNANIFKESSFWRSEIRALGQ